MFYLTIDSGQVPTEASVQVIPKGALCRLQLLWVPRSVYRIISPMSSFLELETRKHLRVPHSVS